MHIVVTEIDKDTRILCTAEPQRTGPSMPDIKGLQVGWVDKSTWPVEVASDGTYLRAPKYYATCDADADLNVAGVLEVLTEAVWLERKDAELLARRPYASWVLVGDEWVAPVSRPFDAILNGGNVRYQWDEATVNWIVATQG